MCNRWPLHPPPLANESLSSWIIRIANRYNMYLEDFLWSEFAISIEDKDAYYLDLNPPLNLLTKLSERTGIELNAVRALTAQGYTPLLIDSLQITKANILNEYINQYRIFPGKRNNLLVTEQQDLIPWLNVKRSVATIRGCKLCLDEDTEPYVRLHWQFLWIMTCPKHKTLLKSFLFYRADNKRMAYIIIDKNNVDLQYSLDALFALDSITLQAVTTGIVKVPSRRTLHGGVWLRILRTLIEELNAPIKIIGQSNRRLMMPFWQELKLSIRQGFGRHTLFEKCNNNTQLILMLIASLVVKAIFTKQINFSNEVTRFLAPILIYDHDLCTVYPELIKKNRLSKEEEREIAYIQAFKNLKTSLDKLMAAMYVDPEVVMSFRNTMKGLDNRNLSKLDESLRKLGIKVID